MPLNRGAYGGTGGSGRFMLLSSDVVLRSESDINSRLLAILYPGSNDSAVIPPGERIGGGGGGGGVAVKSHPR